MIDLIKAYQNTSYTIKTPNISIKIGINNKILNELISTSGATSWAYITAFNPFSKSLSLMENLKRHDELKKMVAKYEFYEGAGVGDDKSWEPETSLLIIGISKDEAISIGKHFKQNAIVVGEINGLPELVILIKP